MLEDNSQTIKVFDPGLESYILKVYNYMSLALIITGVASIITITFQPLTHLLFVLSPDQELLGVTTLGLFIIFLPLFISTYFFFNFQNISLTQAQWLFWTYAWLIGMSLSELYFIYTAKSVASTLFISASVFIIMSLYGYTTNRSLTSLGSFMVMGLIGIMLASLMNLLYRSPAIYFVTSLLGVFIFIGLTAWDTQKIKAIYLQTPLEDQQKTAIRGALTLYLDLVNLFLHLLAFLGKRRDHRNSV